MPIVTLDEVKQHMRIEGNLDDALLSNKIELAEEYVSGFVGSFDAFTDGVPESVKEAIRLMVEFSFDGRNDAHEKAHMLLLPYRRFAF